jgi:hypothetical protein
MRFAIGVLAMLSACTWADERTDQAAIQRVVDALNDYKSGRSRQASDLFTSDSGIELARLSDIDRGLAPTDTPWPEVTKPVIVIRTTRFITSDVALIDAANTQYGSIIVKREIPLLLVVRKDAGLWRIAALRLALDLARPPLASALPDARTPELPGPAAQ